MQNAEWYVDWFNSPYYHLLYNNRDFSEADFFISNLCNHLNLKPGARIWDLACGKGRHALALNKKGFVVTGTDLSANSIKEASRYSNESLDFFVHDMREPFKVNYFDAVFNLFTSLGYFRDVNDNFAVFRNVELSLREEGIFVVDFFNSEKIKESCLTAFTAYQEKRNAITFNINKKVVENSIVKHIEFSDGGKNYYFEESVSLLRKEDFESFAADAGLDLVNIYGNYRFEVFHPRFSDRLILIFKKQ
jgi:ubiquinone/menaquinone biosynthesis C-methylase UbiE